MPDGPRSGSSHRPRKRFGQHFLHDRQAITRIVDALAANAGDTVLEIGPGHGALTDVLVERRLQVKAIEIDRDLARELRQRFAGRDVEIVEANALDVDLGAIAGGPYRLVGNLPYYITTPILFHALTSARPLAAVFLVQREVADRLAAHADTKAYGALSVNVQSVCTVERIAQVKAGAFNPPPSVDSTVVRLTPRVDPEVAGDEEDEVRAFVIAAFGQRRKQLARVLRQIASLSATDALGVLAAAGVSPERRPETLSPREFAVLWRCLSRRTVTM